MMCNVALYVDLISTCRGGIGIPLGHMECAYIRSTSTPACGMHTALARVEYSRTLVEIIRGQGGRWQVARRPTAPRDSWSARARAQRAQEGWHQRLCLLSHIRIFLPPLGRILFGPPRAPTPLRHWAPGHNPYSWERTHHLFSRAPSPPSDDQKRKAAPAPPEQATLRRQVPPIPPPPIYISLLTTRDGVLHVHQLHPAPGHSSPGHPAPVQAATGREEGGPGFGPGPGPGQR